MIGVNNVISRFKSICSTDNLNATIDWYTQNKTFTIPTTITAITFVASKAFFNCSYPNSLLISGITFVATIIDQKKPNLKKQIFEAIKIFAKTNYEQYQKNSIQKKEEAEKENAQLMLSYLKFSLDQIKNIPPEYERGLFGSDIKYSPFEEACKRLGLSETQIQTLLNSYVTFPKSFNDDDKKDYNERYQIFLDLLPEYTKCLFEDIEKKES